MKNKKIIYLIVPVALIILGLFMMYAAIMDIDIPKSFLIIYSVICLLNSIIVLGQVKKK